MQEMKRLLDIVWSFSSKGKPIISGFGEIYLNSEEEKYIKFIVLRSVLQ